MRQINFTQPRTSCTHWSTDSPSTEPQDPASLSTFRTWSASASLELTTLAFAESCTAASCRSIRPRNQQLLIQSMQRSCYKVSNICSGHMRVAVTVWLAMGGSRHILLPLYLWLTACSGIGPIEVIYSLGRSINRTLCVKPLISCQNEGLRLGVCMLSLSLQLIWNPGCYPHISG